MEVVDVSENIKTRLETENSILSAILKLMVGCFCDMDAPNTINQFLYDCFVELMEKDPWAMARTLGKASGGELNNQWVVSLFYRLIKAGGQHNYVRIILIKFVRAFTNKPLKESKDIVENVLTLELEGVPGSIN